MMHDWLIQHLLGIPFQQGSTIVGFKPALRGSIGVSTLIAISIILAAAVGWIYHFAGRHLSIARRFSLTALRILFVLILLILLERPVVQMTLEASVRQTLLLLIDGSSSMTIAEQRIEDADLKRAGISSGLLDPKKGLDQPLDANQAAGLSHLTRLRIVQNVLQNDRLNLIRSLGNDLDVIAFRFGQSLGTGSLLHEAGIAATTDLRGRTTVNLDWVKSLTADASSTAIGDAIHEALTRTRGQPMAGILLVTDGQSNSGASVASAAQDARIAGIPLFTYGVGLKLPRDVIVSRPFSPDIAFVNDEVPLTVRVRSQGLAGLTGRLTLKLGDQEVDQADVHFGADDESVVPLKFTPTVAGEFDLSAEIPARADEAVTTNNRGVTHLRVVDGKIKVLYIEQSPRWEFKYLQALLLRDRRVALNCVLIDGDPEIIRNENSPYLTKIPDSRETLLNYDLIILGDVDPGVFSSDQLNTLSDFVARFGGGLIDLAGRHFNPSGYADIPIAKMLPVDFSDIASTTDTSATPPIALQLTESGKRNSMLRFSDSVPENERIWKDKLSPIYWDARVARPKPAADVLAVDPDPAKESRYGKMPVIAIQQYGVGQVLYVGTDNLWRWRRNQGEGYYQAFWGQAVQRLALPHLLGGSKRVQLLADRDNYSTGEKMTIDARLYDKSFQPVGDAQVNGFLVADNGDRTQGAFRPVPDQPGNYRGQLVAPAPGHYRFFIDRPADPQMQTTQLDLTVTEPHLESEETAMNEAGLREAATLSGGQFYREEDLCRLPEAIRARSQHVQSTVDAEIWCSPAVFILLMSVIIAEWLLRKLWQMK